jgi:hypothetical protein
MAKLYIRYTYLGVSPNALEPLSDKTLPHVTMESERVHTNDSDLIILSLYGVFAVYQMFNGG